MAEIFRDEFTTATDVELSTHSPDLGTSWQKILGYVDNVEESPLTAATDIGLESDNNTLSGGSSATGGGLSDGSLYQANATYATPNMEVSIVVTAQGGSNDPIWLAVRIVDKNNMYVVRIIGGGTDNCQIYKKVAGNWAAIGAAFNGPADGVTVKLKAYGNTISVEYDGVEQRSNFADFNNGKAGLGMGMIGPVSDDNVGIAVNVDTFVVNILSSIKTFTVDGLVKEVKAKTFTVDGIITTVPYNLNNISLPHPNFMFREQRYIKGDLRMIDGRDKRDIVGTKEVIILGWYYLTEAQANAIMSIVNLNSAVTFSVDDGQLQINARSVFPYVKEKSYTVRGSDYLTGMVLELTEETV